MKPNPYNKQTSSGSKKRSRGWEDGERQTITSAPVEDPFDNGIDWNEAVLAIDTAASSSSTSFTERPGSSIGENKLESSTDAVMVSKPDSLPARRPALVDLIDSRGRPPLRPAVATSQTAAAGSSETPNLVSAMASLRPESWKSQAKSASPASTKQTLVAPFHDPRQASLPTPLQFDPKSVEPVQDADRILLVKNADISSPLLNGWTLFSHQKKAILRGLLMRRMILALDMGLGKTLIGCVWSKAFTKTMPDVKVIVLCPVSVKAEWKRTAEETTGLRVSDDPFSGFNDSSDVYLASWGKVPKKDLVRGHRYVVVADEAHSMQSMQAARTRDTLELVRSTSCVGVLLLSGTPMKNGKPSNLFPLLRAVGHPFGDNQRAYEAHFCAGREVSYGRGRAVWNANGSSNLDQLRELTKSHLLHLTKEDCLKNLPPLSRVFKHVPVSSRRQLQHTQAVRELAKVFESSSSKENGNDAVLGAVQKVRMVGSLAKVEATVDLAKTVLQEEAAIVIFTSFVQVAKSVHQNLKEAGWAGELLTGETPGKKRQAMVDNFQQGLSPVFVSTFGAGGVGLTLTAAHTVVLLDRPWTPGDAQQAEDRVRRIGQKKAVKSVWMSAFELDKQIDTLLEQKKQTSDAVLSGGAAFEGVARLSILQLLKNVLPNCNPSDGLTQTSILSFSQGGGT